MMCRIVLIISLLFSSNLLAQRVTNIDHKGTKLTTGVVVTESTTAPTNPTPIQGDIWFDTTTGITKTYDGAAWKEIDLDKVTEAATQPTGTAVEGDFWIDTANNLLKIYDNGSWKTVSSTKNLDDDQKIDTLALQGDTLLQLSLEGDGEAAHEIDLSHLQNTDDQNLSLTTDSLLIEDGTGVKLSDLGTDDQNLSLTTDSLLIEDGTGVKLSDLGTDDQNLSLTTDSLLIEDGTGVKLSDLGTDDQNLSLTTDSLLIEDGTGVKLADLAKEPWFGDDDDAGATTNTEDIYHLGHVGIGVDNPTTTDNKLEKTDGARTGTHSTGRPLYVTGQIDFASNGAEFMHSNATQGIGIGYNSLYAAGSFANHHVNLMPKGTGGAGIGTASLLKC